MTEVGLVLGFLMVLDSIAISTIQHTSRKTAYMTVSLSICVVVVVSHDDDLGKA